MKRYVVTIIVISLSVICSVCMASIPRREMALGGVTLYARFANVQRIYGQPTRTSYEDYHIWGGISRFYTQYYGNESFYVMATNRDGILSVITKANNGISTPSGIKVGMDTDRLLMVYGSPDYTRNEIDGTVVMEYFETREPKGMVDSLAFTVCCGKIIKIELYAGILEL